jgi:hypothetical protein
MFWRSGSMVETLLAHLEQTPQGTQGGKCSSVSRIATALWLIGKQLGPYLALELLLPGGTLLALALFLYRRRRLAGLTRSKLNRKIGRVDSGARLWRTCDRTKWPTEE